MKISLFFSFVLQKVNKFIFLLILVLLYVIPSFSQNYNFPSASLQNTSIGACPVTICSGNFFDNGGASGNYSANINREMTFSSTNPGKCLRVNFTSFNINDTYFLCSGPNSCCDYLTIYDGPNTSSPILYSSCVVSPGTITSTSGSLTFKFTSDGSVQLGGWAATFSCVDCAAGPASYSSSDCDNAIQIFDDTAMANATTGLGLVAEGCAGCFLGETYSNWYSFTVARSGTLGFIIDPNNNSSDFDFAVFPANAYCESLGSPVRCSRASASGNGNTGLGNESVDNSENYAGDQWVASMDVTAGQTYKVLINTTLPNQGFFFDFTLFDGASLKTTATPNYAITTTSGNVVITDVIGTGEIINVSENGSSIRFSVTGKTYSIDGGTVTAFTTPADIALSGKTSITINAGVGNDIINVGTFSNALPTLTVNGGVGNDNINLNGNINFTTNSNLDIDLQNDDASPGTDVINLATNANLILAGTGAATLRTSKNIIVNTGAVLRTENGVLIAEANQQAATSTGDFIGINLSGGTIEATGSANVTVKGIGGNSTNTQRGIDVSAGGKIFGGTSGTLTVDGRAGTSSGTSSNGIRVSGATSKISSYGASININAKGN